MDGRLLAVLATFAVGALVALQPPVNAQLARHTGVLGAAFVSFLVGTIALGGLLLAAGQDSGVPRATNAPWLYLTGGIMGAALISVSLVTVRTLGAGGVVAATVGGRLVVSAVLDRLGLLRLSQVGLTPLRLLGFALLLAGTFLVVLR